MDRIGCVLEKRQRHGHRLLPRLVNRLKDLSARYPGKTLRAISRLGTSYVVSARDDDDCHERPRDGV